MPNYDIKPKQIRLDQKLRDKMNSKENEVIVDVYQKGGKPMESTGTRKKGSKKNVNLKEGQQSF